MAAGLYDISNEVLGKGHFAVVKLARHCLTQELVAVKIIDKTKLNAEALQQHSLEVKLLSRLSEHEHPNIVKLYQVINTKTKLYLVMEYCGGNVCDLYDYIQRKHGGSGLEESEAKHIFRQICSAIEYCHSLRIVHRDLKPENLLIITQPSSDLSDSECPPPSPPSPYPFKYPIVKLIDFGFANQWQEGVKLKTSCGSLAYSAPEILLGDHYDGDKVDIWGLGCILYILLYGCNPFMQINDNETLIKILDCSFSTPPRPTISDAAIKLIKSLLRKDPSSRLSVSQVLADLWFNPTEGPGTQERTKGSISPPSNETHRTPSDPNDHSNDFTSVSKVNISPERNFNNNNTSNNNNNGSSSFDASVPNNGQGQELPTTNSSSVTSSVTIHSFRSKSPTSVNEVHDRVIAEMISQKMCPSRERIERAIRLARVNSAVYVASSSPSHRSPFNSSSPLPVVGESVPLNLSSTNDQSGNPAAGDSNVTSEVDFSLPHCNDSYIMATYNLLKDKIMREIQGIPLQAATLQEVKSGPKRGHTLPGPRKRGPGVSQAPRFGRPNATTAGKVGLDESSLRQKLQEEESLRGNDIVPEDECVPLPLQRKCSIVSEEGSCELSGRLSDTGSDLHVLLVSSDDRKVSSVPQPVSNRVDIVITDISTLDCPDGGNGGQDGTKSSYGEGDLCGNLIRQSDSPTDLAAEVDLSTYPLSDATRLPENDCDDLKKDQQVKCKLDAGMNRTDGKLPLVSSSPDFSREYAQDINDESASTVDVFCASEAHTGHSRGQRSHFHRPATMFIDQDEDVLVDDVGEHVQKERQTRKNRQAFENQLNTGAAATDGSIGQAGDSAGENLVTNNKTFDSNLPSNPSIAKEQCSSLSSSSASKHKTTRTDRVGSSSLPVRIITQSKSCNNIRCSEKNNSPDKDIVNANGGNSPAKKLGPCSLVTRRRSKEDKKDCCVIS